MITYPPSRSPASLNYDQFFVSICRGIEFFLDKYPKLTHSALTMVKSKRHITSIVQAGIQVRTIRTYTLCANALLCNCGQASGVDRRVGVEGPYRRRPASQRAQEMTYDSRVCYSQLMPLSYPILGIRGESESDHLPLRRPPFDRIRPPDLHRQDGRRRVRRQNFPNFPTVECRQSDWRAKMAISIRWVVRR